MYIYCKEWYTDLPMSRSEVHIYWLHTAFPLSWGLNIFLDNSVFVVNLGSNIFLFLSKQPSDAILHISQAWVTICFCCMAFHYCYWCREAWPHPPEVRICLSSSFFQSLWIQLRQYPKLLEISYFKCSEASPSRAFLGAFAKLRKATKPSCDTGGRLPYKNNT